MVSLRTSQFAEDKARFVGRAVHFVAIATRSRPDVGAVIPLLEASPASVGGIAVVKIKSCSARHAGGIVVGKSLVGFPKAGIEDARMTPVPHTLCVHADVYLGELGERPTVAEGIGILAAALGSSRKSSA